MTRSRLTVATAAAGALLVALTACTTTTATSESASPADPGQPASEQGTAAASPSSGNDTGGQAQSGSRVSYEQYEQDPSKYADTEVVLHFSAPWCPTCVATNESLEEAGVPAGLTVVTVDYDSSQDLKQRYGVTTQHTFVQIDESGEEKTRFTGSITGADIQSNLV
jgi:thiol-disulfide isomerase/thioredoxin